MGAPEGQVIKKRPLGGPNVLLPVALDAMGGDHAPQATVAGAVLAAQNLHIPILLVGDQNQIKAELAHHTPLPDGLEIVHTEAAIGMDESPGSALMRKRDASIIVAMNLVKEGRASGVVSGGNSGAAMGAAALRLGTLARIERPAIAMLLPSRRGSVVMLDGGATVDSRPENLLDFACMGSVYARSLLHIERPRVGLLNIGEEPSKGNLLIKQTFTLLSDSSLNFVGNIEGKDIARGNIEVVVCDGFVGNVVLKAVEGFVELFWETLRKELSQGWKNKLGAWLLRPRLRRLAQQWNYSSYGGALLAGVNGICVIAHGRSTPAAIESAIRVVKELAEQGVVAELAKAFNEENPWPVRVATLANENRQNEQ